MNVGRQSLEIASAVAWLNNELITCFFLARFQINAPCLFGIGAEGNPDKLCNHD